MTRIKPGPHRPSVFKLDEWPVVWGVYVGDGCVSAADPLEWANIHAHAHNKTDDPWFGWICIADDRKAFTKLGRPSLLMKHEVAHLLVPNAMHNAKWKKVLTGMGGTSEVKKYLITQKNFIKLDNINPQ